MLLDIPEIGTYVTVTMPISGRVDRSYIDEVWRVLSINETCVLLENKYRNKIMVYIGERKFALATAAMLEAFFGTEIANAYAANLENLETQLADIAGLATY